MKDMKARWWAVPLTDDDGDGPSFHGSLMLAVTSPGVHTYSPLSSSQQAIGSDPSSASLRPPPSVSPCRRPRWAETDPSSSFNPSPVVS